MRKLFASLCAAAMAVTAVATTSVGAIAAPVVPMVKSEAPTVLAEQVQYRRYPRRGFYRRGGDGFYNGHRGYRNYRRGYRRHNDFWFPAGAFVAGAIIGGALSGPSYDYAPRRVYRGGGNAHVRWCYNRYRSYRAYDNTFQPYNGGRQQCYSPYN